MMKNELTVYIHIKCGHELCESVTLPLNYHKGIMGSAHGLLDVKMCAKFEENPSVVTRFIVRTRWRWAD
jgi:hypothetical protein